MNLETLQAFGDELRLIKTSGFMRDVGRNLGNTLRGFTAPVAAMKKGWEVGGWTQGTEAKNMMAAGFPVGNLGQKWSTGKGVGRFLPGSKAMTLGFGASSLPGAVSKEDPTGRGEGRATRVARLVGGTAGGLIGAPYGLSGSIAGSLIGEHGAKYVGKAIDKARGNKNKKPPIKEPELPEPAQARIQGPQVE